MKLEYAVEVAPVELREVGYVVTAPGSIQAFEQVQVTARVGGAVDKVAFTEGQAVKAGQVLAIIEVDRYQVAVDQAKAAVDKAAATEAQAEAQLSGARRATRSTRARRGRGGRDLRDRGCDREGRRSGGKGSEARRGAEPARRLCPRADEQRHPDADGRDGQYLQPGAVLATLLQRDPLLLKFSVTESDAPRITPGMSATSPCANDRAPTRRRSRSSPRPPIRRLTSLRSQPQVDDKEHKYWLRPGVFCDVTLPVGATRKSAIVPEISIRATERGFLGYVVDGTIARGACNAARNAHRRGLRGGDRARRGEHLVVLGAEPLSDGAPVKISQRTTLEAFDGGVTATPCDPTDGAPAPSRRRCVDGGAHAVNITDVCLRKPVLAWMLMAGTILFGLVAATRIGVS